MEAELDGAPPFTPSPAAPPHSRCQACYPPTKAASSVPSSAASRRRSFGNTMRRTRSQVRVREACDAALCCRYSLVRGTAIAFCMTLFEVFDIPVFWPILVLYVGIPSNTTFTLHFSCFFFRFNSTAAFTPALSHPRLTLPTATSSFFCSLPCVDRFSTCEPARALHFFVVVARSSFPLFSWPWHLSSSPFLLFCRIKHRYVPIDINKPAYNK